jgi:acyl-[acyl-carrier-protein]-phospholipid O-acyltransferase/long-chain-fatty-acid--[acyl-carrier-protein] ligase
VVSNWRQGHLDDDGFLTIVDRYSRFAKIGGEMISLTTVEEEILDALNDKDLEIAATCLPDQRKGEKIVLLSTNNIEKSELKKFFRMPKLIPYIIHLLCLLLMRYQNLEVVRQTLGLLKKLH